MWGFVPALWFVVLRNFIASLERPRAAMVIMLIGVLLNAIAAYGLIFGRLGLPALGLRGAGIAAALTNCLLFAGLLGYILVDRQFRRFHILGRLWRPEWDALSRDLPDRAADRHDAGHGGRPVRHCGLSWSA